MNGIHHVTAISSDPAATLRFYSDTLGLRLVKQTVNFDDPGTLHLYFGDRTGAPGSIPARRFGHQSRGERCPDRRNSLSASPA